MARSTRRVPIFGIACAESDKPYKVSEHRRERRAARAILNVVQDGDAPALHKTNFGDPCRAPKDGKQYCVFNAKELRK